jgi:4-hydroxybenzoate polyprenyltransferase
MVKPAERFRRAGAHQLVYARLVRLPNLFTAPPDVILGASIVADLGYAVTVRSVAGLAVASMLLYAAGTSLNDYVDAAEDACKRPDRPIPSGAISRSRALAFGVSLLFCGVLVALATAGTNGGAVAGVLALLVVLYDGVFKGTMAGPFVMGGARGVNVLLGVAVAVDPSSISSRSLSIPLVVALYIAAVTYMAESESGDQDRLAVPTAAGGVVIAATGVGGNLVLRSPTAVDTAVSIVILFGFVTWTGWALVTAHAEPSPETIGPAVGRCVLGLVVLDAALGGATGSIWSLVILIFLVPALVLARVVDVH